MTKIISVTMTHDDSETLVDTLRSVSDEVDHCLVIDTSKEPQKFEFPSYGRVFWIHNPWPGRFDEARNFCLAKATELFSEGWVLLLDDDEWLVPSSHGAKLRTELEEQNCDMLLMQSNGATYWKEKLFRIPTTVRYNGRTHEAPTSIAGGRVWSVSFAEHFKSAEKSANKFRRDVALLNEQIKEQPSDPRWWYYLGDTYENLGNTEEAMFAFAKCAVLPGWDEQSAWAYYRLAQCCCVIDKWEEAVRNCAAGLSRRSDMAELAWLAAWASYIQVNYLHAEAWATVSISLGSFQGLLSRNDTRCSFRYLPGLWEGPFDILTHVCEKMGRPVEASQHRHNYQCAKAARIAKYGP